MTAFNRRVRDRAAQQPFAQRHGDASNHATEHITEYQDEWRAVQGPMHFVIGRVAQQHKGTPAAGRCIERAPVQRQHDDDERRCTDGHGYVGQPFTQRETDEMATAEPSHTQTQQIQTDGADDERDERQADVIHKQRNLAHQRAGRIFVPVTFAARAIGDASDEPSDD